MRIHVHGKGWLVADQPSRAPAAGRNFTPRPKEPMGEGLMAQPSRRRADPKEREKIRRRADIHLMELVRLLQSSLAPMPLQNLEHEWRELRITWRAKHVWPDEAMNIRLLAAVDECLRQRRWSGHMARDVGRQWQILQRLQQLDEALETGEYRRRRWALGQYAPGTPEHFLHTALSEGFQPHQIGPIKPRRIW